MDYAGWITATTNLLEYQVTDATSAAPTGTAFDAMIPSAVDYTENRLQRDLDFLATTVAARGAMLANNRLVTLPSVNIPTVSQIPSLIGTPIAPGSIITTTLGSMIANINWPGYGLTAGQDISIPNPTKVGGLTLGGVYQIITAVDAENFTINTSFDATSNASVVYIGNGIFVVCRQISPIIGGVRQQPLEPVTRDYLDFAWPSDASVGPNIPPVQWCPNDQATVLVGPAPDQAYAFEAVGTMRIPQLSPTNYQNFLTQQFPDLYVAASMIFLSGYQRDFGGQSEDPQLAQSWENQYQLLLKSAVVEEARKQFSDMFPSPSKPTSLTAQA